MFKGSVMAADVKIRELMEWFGEESNLARKQSFLTNILEAIDGQPRQIQTVEVEKKDGNFKILLQSSAWNLSSWDSDVVLSSHVSHPYNRIGNTQES